MIYYYQKDPPAFSLGVPPHLLCSLCPPPEERHLSMPEMGEYRLKRQEIVRKQENLEVPQG